jgi:Na+/H+ antiporter NhaD/arsenite permease-like protein
MSPAPWVSLAVFALVYLAMALGRVPAMRLDRTGAALLGALVCVASGLVDAGTAWAAIDVPTIALLFAMMVLSAQLAAAGAWARLAAYLAAARTDAPRFLLLVVLVSGGLSAILTNDVVCLALAPLVADVAARRGLHPLPHLLGLAAAANVGGALTLIGNPQNILVGQTLQLDFGGYIATAALPVCAGLAIVWLVLWLQWRGRFDDGAPRGATTSDAPPHDAWQAWKGALLVLATMLLFLVGSWPREAVALGAAALVLCSRRIRGADFLARVDWPLLVLFMGLFVVHAAFARAGWMDALSGLLARTGVDLAQADTLYWASVPLSNLVSNVPATMLLLESGVPPSLGAHLALGSTLAGNLLLVGSIANLIVAEEAKRRGIAFGWREHAKAGVPIGCATLVVAWWCLRGAA